MHKKWLIVSLWVISGLLGFLTYGWLHPHQREPIHKSIQVVHYPSRFVKQIEHDRDAGRKIFNEFCTSCHGKQPLIEVNAPLLGDKTVWQVKQKLGMPVLLKKTIQGIGAMPARGGCFECSDEQLQEALNYILSQSK